MAVLMERTGPGASRHRWIPGSGAIGMEAERITTGELLPGMQLDTSIDYARRK